MKYEPVKEFTKTKLVIGEGVDEWAIFQAILKHSQLDEDIAAEQFEGKSRITDGIKGIAKRPGFKSITSLLVTRDADFLTDPQALPETVVDAAFQSVCHALRAANLPVPSQPFVIETGSYQEADFRVGVCIFPGPNQIGMLEDLCFAATNDPATNCVDALWACIAEKFPDGSRAHSREAFPKARIHAWLATRPKPDQRLGEAALNGEIDFNHAAFDDFKRLLREL